MAINYLYGGNVYTTEADAQTAVANMSVRLENNPTDWVQVKEITGSNETGWVMNPTRLEDAEILSPDESKMYMCYSMLTGANEMPLTASELAAKRDEYRTVHAQDLRANTIIKIDDSTDPETIIEVTPTTDMSGYV